MNDFDFEELDKAVNNLAVKTHDEHGGTELGAPIVVTPAASVPVEKPTVELKTETTPVAEEPKATAIPVASPQKHPSRLSETRPRSRGSFMDIVPPAQRKGGTRGISLQPVSRPEDIVPEESAHSEPEVPTPVVRDVPTVEPAAEKPVATEQKKSTDEVSWPDPLDFGGASSEKSAAEEEKPEVPAEAPATPFLAEAKVEKRPLGAFSHFKAAVPEAKPDETPVAEPAEAKPQDELTPEKDGNFKEPEEAAPKPEEKPEAPKSESADEPAKPDLHGTAMMSIPQQYHTEAKQTDKATRPIFDTKEYHPPLVEATSHEHRGGGGMWGKIFIAFVVLVLLAVAGYFAYLYLMQR